MQIKNIVFDFGGVLIDWNPRYLYKDVFSKESEVDYFLQEVCNAEWNIQQDAGRSFKEGISELIKLFPDYEKEIKLYYSDWIKMISGEIKENTSLLKELKDEFRLFGLTNWSAETFPLVYPHYSFFDYLEGIIVSGKEKLSNIPDRREK